MDPQIIIPRFVECVEYDPDDGNIRQYTWDKDKITVEEFLADDLLMLQNVFEGKIISPSIYPLIYEKKSAVKETSMRSLEFYREVAQDNSVYKLLPKEDKIYFLIGLRDLFVASCRRLLSKEEEELLVKMTNLIDPNDEDEDILHKRINDIEVTPYPTYKNKMVRFVDEKSENIEDEYFIRNELNLLICFADPQDLSYHNFENIINLDSLFVLPPNFSITNIQKESDADVYTFDMTDSTKILASFDKYDLYVEPLNKLSRGQRFIFSSEKLSHALTTSIRSAGFEKDHLITDKFRFVNSVFRYNKFKPTDKKFSSHFDTPYYDPAKKHYSKYTIILYLTSGQADPILSVNKGSVRIDKIDTKGEIKGVIFDQRYEHEGKSFIKGDKIFLRSELIFEFDEKDGFSFDEQVSKKFNIGCYMTKQSVFNSELEKYASDCFNHAAEARLSMSKLQVTKDILLYKRYKNNVFVTNGYDYWFSKDYSLQEAAILVMLDYLNCKLESGEAFNKLTYHEILPLNIEKTQQIYAYLKEEHKNPNLNIEENKELEENVEVDVLDKYPLDKDCCCIMHYSSFDPKKNRSVRRDLEDFREFSAAKLQRFKDRVTISVFDKKVEINMSNIMITDNAIIFDSQVPSINFAACWNSGTMPYDFVSSETLIAKGYTNIPPIWYQTCEEGHHLKIELFNNGFVRIEEKKIKKFDISDKKVDRPTSTYYYDYHPSHSDSSANADVDDGIEEPEEQSDQDDEDL